MHNNIDKDKDKGKDKHKEAATTDETTNQYWQYD